MEEGLQSLLQSKTNYIKSRRGGGQNLPKKSILVPNERKSSFGLEDFEANKRKSRINKDRNILRNASSLASRENRRNTKLGIGFLQKKRGTVKMSHNVKLLSEMIDSTKRKNFTGLNDNNLDKDVIRQRQRALIQKEIKKGFEMDNMDYRSEWLTGTHYDQNWKMIKRCSAKW